MAAAQSPAPADPAEPDAKAPSPPPWRLQTRLRRQLLGLLALLWLLGTGAATLGLWHETDEVLDSALAETAQRLLMLPDAALIEPDTAGRLGRIATHEEHVVYQVLGADGSLVLRSHDAPVQPLDPGAPDGLRAAGAWWVLTLSDAHGHRRAQVAETLAHRREVLWASVGWLLGTLLALLPAAGLGLGWVLRRGFAALEPARAELAARLPPADAAPPASAGHDPLAPIPPAVAQRMPEELRPWLDTVQALLARVHALVDAERAFAANTAHELRTPLAAARAQAQRLAQASADGPQREAADALLRQLDRLTALSSRLLQLARVESGAALRRAPVDLAQLAALVADDFPDARRGGRLRLQVQGRPPPVAGDLDTLGIALRNLIDNALHHGGGQATVTVRVDAGRLQVADDGPGVPAEQLARLGRPFERANPERGVPGHGLGLALVATIARQSGARLTLQSPRPDGPGFVATLDFGAGPADGGGPGPAPP